MEKEICVPNELMELANILKCKGALYIVGGYVRNSLLGIRANDIDLASSILPEDIISLLENTKYTVKEKSRKTGVLQIVAESGLIFEHATFRKEEYKVNSGEHMPLAVEFTLDIREDAKRRDFTINCIYYDILKKRFIDIYSGVYDLNKKLIRCVETPEKVFESDGERILRMIRFASELNFKIDRSTYVIAKKMAYRLVDVSCTRKYNELSLILNSSQKYEISKPKAYLRGLKMVNSFNIWANMCVPVAKVKYYMVKKVSVDFLQYGLLIDIIDTIEPDGVEYYLRYLLGVKGFKLPIKKTDHIIKIMCGYFDALNNLSNKKYFARYYANFDEIGKLVSIRSKALFNKYNFFYKYINNHHLPVAVRDLKITEQEIKKRFSKVPERKHKKILNDLLSKVFEGEIENDYNVLLKEIKDNVNSGNY